MFSLDSISVAFGGFTLLDAVSFHISPGDKIGLVGKNGAGKSTLMKIICGLQKPTSGQVDKPSGATIGYLPQIMEHHRGRTVLEETMTAFDELLAVEREMDEVSRQLADRTDYESDDYNSLIEHLNELSDRLSVSHDEPLEVQAIRTLEGLGFRRNELDRKTETFSQGWNMRIELAKILLGRPDLLLLDEPTNHLDIESIEWLEDYLKNSRSAILLVSHDRKFLDNVTSRTIEIMLGRIYDYKVPYTQYLELRQERMAQQLAAYRNQQRMIEKTEDFIERFRYKPTKSNQVQSRVKALERLERIEVDEEDNSTLHVRFPKAPRCGDVAFKAIGLSAAYPGKTVFTDADIEIKRGEKVALVGRNGEGKTTLMRIIMRELAPAAGSAQIGHNVHIGYYAQNQEDTLDGKETVFGTLDRIAVGDVRTRLRDILAAFLFKGEDIDKRVSVLSGGERARLGMAKLMLQDYNLLALDEPTNHMDIRSKDVLKQALLAYDGALVVVSHDRDFLDGLVDKVYEFRDGRVREHLGGVSDFLRRRRLESLRDLDRPAEPAASSGPAARAGSAAGSGPAARAGSAAGSASSGSRSGSAAGSCPGPRAGGAAGPKASFAEMKSRSKEEKKKRERVERLEAEIEKLEGEMKAIEAVLSNPGEGDDIMELTRSYLELKYKLDVKTEEWGALI